MTRQLVHVVGAAILDGPRCLVAQRGPAMSSRWLWEFPGGKVEPGERPEAALVRELSEELGVTVSVGPRLGVGEVASPSDDRLVIRLEVYEATLVAGQPEAREHAELRWLSADELEPLAWAAADVPVVPRVVEVLRRRG